MKTEIIHTSFQKAEKTFGGRQTSFFIEQEGQLAIFKYSEYFELLIPFFFFNSDNLWQKLPDNSWFSPPPISELKQRVLWGEFCQIQHCSLGGRGLKIIKNELSGIFLPGIVGRKAVYKFTKLSKIWFSMKCFTGDFLRFFTKKHQNLALAWQAEYSPSNPSISGIFLKLPNFLRS